MKYNLVCVAAAIMVAFPAAAEQRTLEWSGTVDSIQNGVGPNPILEGESITARFSFDLDRAISYGDTALGGGTYSIYSLTVPEFSLSVGNYLAEKQYTTAYLTYIDNSFGSDAIVFVFDGLPGGPFGSMFANVQFQARGPASAIGIGGTSNDLPFDRFKTSFFGGFSSGSQNSITFGDLAVSQTNPVPEPATWAMMILGFGVIGYSLRKRQAVKTAVRFA